MTSAKETIKALLEDASHGVKVLDDGDGDAPPVYNIIQGKISLVWLGNNEFASKGWVITIGPVVGADAQLSSLGSFSKWIREDVQLDVWVMDKRSENYVPERIRGDLVQEVDRCLHHFAASPGAGFNVVNAGGWSELDEVGLLRTSMRASVEYEKTQA